MRNHNIIKGILLFGALTLLSACSDGGKLTIENGVYAPIQTTTKGSPFVTVNQGGKAYMTGGVGPTAVTGYVTIQAVTATTISGGGYNVILNNSQAQVAARGH